MDEPLPKQGLLLPTNGGSSPSLVAFWHRAAVPRG